MNYDHRPSLAFGPTAAALRVRRSRRALPRDAEIAPLAKLFLHRSRAPWDRRPTTVQEVDTANALAKEWAGHWFDEKTAQPWVAKLPQIDAGLAARFRDRGVSADIAATRLWYGQVNNARPPIAYRVMTGSLTIEQACRELAEYGLIVVGERQIARPVPVSPYRDGR